MPAKQTIFRVLSIALILASLLGLETRPSLAAGNVSSPQVLAGQCLGAGSETAQNDLTGKLRFLGADAGQPIQWSNNLRYKSPELAARGYLSMCGSLFGLGNQAAELVLQRQRRTDDGRSVVRFQQVVQGIPVFTGELLIQLDANNNVLLVNGKIQPALNVDTRPRVTAAAAQREARRVVAETHQVKAAALTVSQAKLWVYDPALLGQDGAAALVWRVEVTARDGSPIRELVLVEAARGTVVLHFNQVDEALYRYTFTSNNTNVQRLALVCDETNPTCAGGDIDAVNAHTYAGDTYNFYFANHNRDSIDNTGMPLISNVHYSAFYCNAFWDGTQMTYGDGCFIVTDDVVAHELTHGVTQYESNLIYYLQPGAINESFSDIWGEFVDLGNGSGTDTPAVRWLIGEDVSSGAFRDMKNPPAFHQPDRMGHAYYYRGGMDHGGVHTNSGVGNKAAYLIVDGDTFNGYTVNGIGVTKAAKIYYEVQANILLSNSTYADLYNALYAACINLTGKHGITLADCAEVRKATQATEMNPTPPAEFTDCAAVTAIPTSECDALVALYNSTNGATGWNSKLNWLLDESPCNWLGVTCDASTPAHVTSLALNANNLSGALPAELGNLASLQTLDLGGNPLSGEIPASLATLASLTSLTLDCGPYTSNPTVLTFLNATIAGGWNCITLSGNAALAGASLNLLDPLPKSFVTDSSGNYIFSVTSNLPDLIVTPFKQGYAFTPSRRTYANVTSDQTAQDYAAVVDADPPTVLSVTRANPDPTSLSFVDFTVTFSEPVTDVDLGDFALVPGGVSGATLSGLSGSDASYTLTADTGSGSGTLGLNLPADASINDLAGNPLATLPYTSGETYTVEKDEIAPSVLSITRANPNPTNLSLVDFTVTFTEPVTGVDLGDFTLVPGGVSGVTLSGLSGSDASYTLTADTGRGNGTLRLDLPADAFITDLAGNPLTALPYTTGETYTIIRGTASFTSIATQDGWIRESFEISNGGGALDAAATIFNLGDDKYNRQYRAILSFDLSSLPANAVITKVTLKIRKQGQVGADPFATLGKILVDIRTGAFGNNNALQLTDFQSAAHKNSGAIIQNTPVSNWYSVTFPSASLPFLNLTGVTQFRLRFQIGDNGNRAADYLKFFSGDHPTASVRPTLIIEYYVP